MNLSAQVAYSSGVEPFQYADTVIGADERDAFYMARMDRRTLSTTLRCDINFSPRISLTYYGNVYATSGAFDRFKHIIDPLASAYEDRFFGYSSGDVDRSVEGSVLLAGDGSHATLDDPDFNYRAFTSNLVLRWEYKAGSNLYFVWSQNRTSDHAVDGFSANKEFGQLFDSPAGKRLPDQGQLLVFPFEKYRLWRR